VHRNWHLWTFRISLVSMETELLIQVFLSVIGVQRIEHQWHTWYMLQLCSQSWLQGLVPSLLTIPRRTTFSRLATATLRLGSSPILSCCTRISTLYSNQSTCLYSTILQLQRNSNVNSLHLCTDCAKHALTLLSFDFHRYFKTDAKNGTKLQALSERC
jgi:hypothetical protein